jgi:hypothetical protein
VKIIVVSDHGLLKLAVQRLNDREIEFFTNVITLSFALQGNNHPKE